MTQIIHIRNNCNEFISIDFLQIVFKSFDTLIAERLNDTWVIVSDTTPHVTPNDNNICNVITDGRHDVVTVSCDYKNRNPPLRGQYVTVRRKDDANERNFLNLCEVEVLSCRPGFWGKDSANEDCSQSCGHCVEQTCRVLDGYCYTGCQGETVTKIVTVVDSLDAHLLFLVSLIKRTISFLINASCKMSTKLIIVASLESAHSLIWGSYEIWGQGGG